MVGVVLPEVTARPQRVRISYIHPVTMAWRGRGDGEYQIGPLPVADPVRRARLYVNAVMGMNGEHLAINLHRRDAGQDKEELFRAIMVMRFFSGIGGHALLNDAQPVRCDQMPAIAAITPDIMPGRPGAYHWHAYSHSITKIV